jgi:hypothetical protein
MRRPETSIGPSRHADDDNAWARAAIMGLLTLKAIIIAALIFLILQVATTLL